MAGVKSRIKDLLSVHPPTQRVLVYVVKRFRMLVLLVRCYSYDLAQDAKFVGWIGNDINYKKLSSELIFFFHKIEKGLSLPGDKRFFGEDAVDHTIRLLAQWKECGYSEHDPVYMAALESLRAYRRRLIDVPPRNESKLLELNARLGACLDGSSEKIEMSTPIPNVLPGDGSYDVLLGLAIGRRSVRDFSGELVSKEALNDALRIASLSPSACNRQPWRVHFYDQRSKIAELLALQNGNRGFDKTIPLLAVVTASRNSFFDATERSEPVLDAGLFLMSFLLGLHSLGLSSCCLNWCVQPDSDKAAHEIGQIPSEEKIITFLAIGVASEAAVVPRSGRRSLTDLAVFH